MIQGYQPMTTVTPAVQAYERRKLGKQGKVERASKTARLVVDPSRAAGQKYMEPPAAAPELYALRQQFAKGQSRSAAYGRSISFGGEGVSLNSLASKWSGNTKEGSATPALYEIARSGPSTMLHLTFPYHGDFDLTYAGSDSTFNDPFNNDSSIVSSSVDTAVHIDDNEPAVAVTDALGALLPAPSAVSCTIEDASEQDPAEEDEIDPLRPGSSGSLESVVENDYSSRSNGKSSNADASSNGDIYHAANASLVTLRNFNDMANASLMSDIDGFSSLAGFSTLGGATLSQENDARVALDRMRGRLQEQWAELEEARKNVRSHSM